MFWPVRCHKSASGDPSARGLSLHRRLGCTQIARQKRQQVPRQAVQPDQKGQAIRQTPMDDIIQRMQMEQNNTHFSVSQGV
jgi:hypothetical protein